MDLAATFKLKLRPVEFLLFVCFLLSLLNMAENIGWLAMIGMSSTAQLVPHKCATLNKLGLNKRQVRLCRRNVEHMDSVRVGAHLALMECQYQFRNRRWNCTMIDPVSLFGNALKLGTRETAFVHAISAAGVAHKVTRDCSSGLLHKCGCDSSFRGDSGLGFQWAGCSDNVHYGNAFSRAFVDAHERKKKQPMEKMLMNLHNNEAGRKVVEKNMGLQCKCHGVSGSCELKTCWRAMPNFRQIGALLKDKFDGATEVKSLRSGSRKTLVPLFSYLKRQTTEDLVYLDQSPDYCNQDSEKGTLGTNGRHCNRSSQGIDGCELLCCNRGYHTSIQVKKERCKCKFHWCCHVKCKECLRHEEINVCK